MLPTALFSLAPTTDSAPQGSTNSDVEGLTGSGLDDNPLFQQLMNTIHETEGARLSETEFAALGIEITAIAGKTSPPSDLESIENPELLSGNDLISYLMANAGIPDESVVDESVFETLDDSLNLSKDESNESNMDSGVQLLTEDSDESAGDLIPTYSSGVENINVEDAADLDVNANSAGSVEPILNSDSDVINIGNTQTLDSSDVSLIQTDENFEAHSASSGVLSTEVQSDSLNNELGEGDALASEFTDEVLKPSVEISSLDSVAVENGDDVVNPILGVSSNEPGGKSVKRAIESILGEAASESQSDEESSVLKSQNKISNNIIGTEVGLNKEQSVKSSVENPIASQTNNSNASVKSEGFEEILSQSGRDTASQTSNYGIPVDESLLDGQKSLNQRATIRPSIEQQLMAQQEVLNRPVKLATAEPLSERIFAMVRGEIQHAVIRLDPPELGAMEIKLQVQQEQTQIQIVVQSSQVREALEQHSARLREALAEQGLEMANLDVTDQQTSANEQGESKSNNSEEGVDIEDEEFENTAASEIKVGLVDQYV